MSKNNAYNDITYVREIIKWYPQPQQYMLCDLLNPEIIFMRMRKNQKTAQLMLNFNNKLNKCSPSKEADSKILEDNLRNFAKYYQILRQMEEEKKCDLCGNETEKDSDKCNHCQFSLPSIECGDLISICCFCDSLVNKEKRLCEFCITTSIDLRKINTEDSLKHSIMEDTTDTLNSSIIFSERNSICSDVSLSTITDENSICDNLNYDSTLNSKQTENSSIDNNFDSLGQQHCINIKKEKLDEKYVPRNCKICKAFIKELTCPYCQYKDEYLNKWICEKCGLYNRLLASKCKLCKFNNGNLVYCSRCFLILKVIHKSAACCVTCFNKFNVNWKCWRFSCGALNDTKERFCTKCFIHKEKSYDTTRINGSMEFNVWVCKNCVNINNFKATKCSKCKKEKDYENSE